MQKIHGEREIIIYFAKFCHGKTFVEYDGKQFFDVWRCHKNNVYKFNENLKILNNLIMKGENNLSELELQNLEGLFDIKNKIFFDYMYKKFNDNSLLRELIQLRKNKSDEYITDKLKRNRLEAYNYLLMGNNKLSKKNNILMDYIFQFSQKVVYNWSILDSYLAIISMFTNCYLVYSH